MKYEKNRKGNFLLKQFVRYVINSIPYRRFCFLYLDFILIFDQVQDYQRLWLSSFIKFEIWKFWDQACHLEVNMHAKEKTMIHWKIKFRQLSQSRRISFMAIKTAKLERFLVIWTWTYLSEWKNIRNIICYHVTKYEVGMRLPYQLFILKNFVAVINNNEKARNWVEYFFLQRSNCFRSWRDQSYVLTCLVNYWRSCGSQKNWLMSLLS